jgi:hypothetical protein
MVACAVAFSLLLVSMLWPVGGYAPFDHLPSTSPDHNETMDVDPPAAPALLSTILTGASNEDVLITWSLSADDGAGNGDVSHYAVYTSDSYDYEGDSYSYLGQAGSGGTSFTHTLAGDGDWADHFYYVQANDTSGNGNWSGQAGKFVRFIEKGKHLASVPLVQEDTTLEVVLQTLAGSFKHVRYYKSSDQSNHWKTYWTFKTYGTLFEIDHTMGFWIDMTKDDHLVVAGLVPDVTQIELGHNWNLVSYPSFIDRTVSDALAGIDWQKVQGWGATPPHHQRQMGADDMMTAGHGYWIWVDLPQVLEVCNKPCDPPYIVSTTPADGATDVPLDSDIIVDFNKPIDVLTFSWTFFPDPGGWMESWSNGNQTVTLSHAVPYMEGLIATVAIIRADDLEGNALVPGPVPNPFTFWTGSQAPYIVQTEPANGEIETDVYRNITVLFSEPVNTSSVSFTFVPDHPGWVWTETWFQNDMLLVLEHSEPFAELMQYTVTVDGADKSGEPLAPGPVPNPWSFATTCVCPYIVATYPMNAMFGVPADADIVVNFSQPMDTTSVIWSVDYDPGGWTLTWMAGDTVLVMSHSNPFYPDNVTVHIIYATDKEGDPLVPGPVPNPWIFFVLSPGPYVLATDPYHNETNVSLTRDISIWFSAPMNASTLAWSITTGPDPGGWSDVWPSSDSLVLTHANPFQPSTTYIFELTYIEGENGLPLFGLPIIIDFTTVS